MDQLIVALDVETTRDALSLADGLSGIAGAYKIGSRLFTSDGPAMVRTLTERGSRVFLDLKFHDIPNTVATAVAAATALRVWMVDVHAAGGMKMMRAARDAAQEAAARAGIPRPLVIAVTVLTSIDAVTLQQTGVDREILDQVLRLAELTQVAGLDGVVASPRETPLIRQRCGPDFTIVTPGIRGGAASSGKDDQERTLTAAEALAAGASYLVVGRPIIAAADPRMAAEAIAREAEDGVVRGS